jgi:hypothetical protein
MANDYFARPVSPSPMVERLKFVTSLACRGKKRYVQCVSASFVSYDKNKRIVWMPTVCSISVDLGATAATAHKVRVMRHSSDKRVHGLPPHRPAVFVGRPDDLSETVHVREVSSSTLGALALIRCETRLIERRSCTTRRLDDTARSCYKMQVVSTCDSCGREPQSWFSGTYLSAG